MFSKNDSLTESEKVDKIFKILKAQERNNRISFVLKWALRLFVIYYLFVLYWVFVNNSNPELKEKIMTPLKTLVTSIAEPIVNELLGSIDTSSINVTVPNIATQNQQSTGTILPTRRQNIKTSEINKIIKEQLENLKSN